MSVVPPAEPPPTPDSFTERFFTQQPGIPAPRTAPGEEDGGPDRDSDPGGPPRRGRRRAPRSRRRKVLRAGCLTLTVLLLAAVGGGWYLYNKLSGNLHTSALHAAAGPSAALASEAPGVINILLIGSDSRAGLGAAYGDAENTLGNADVMMLMHISADHSNATVVSIPRDLITHVPACRAADGTTVPAAAKAINGSHVAGPGCTVDAVQELTGVPINHFIQIDFRGVVDMTNDVGGVPVCVNAAVDDPYTHLHLTPGVNIVSGDSALALLRSRHGFSDGSDLYRTQVQHMYLSSLLRTIESGSTLTSPTTLYSLADHATRALTVDPTLDSVGDLISLGRTIGNIQPHRITFLTLPTQPYPYNPNQVIPNHDEDRLIYGMIDADQSFTTTNGHPVTAIPTAALTAAAGPSTAAPASGNASDGASDDGASATSGTHATSTRGTRHATSTPTDASGASGASDTPTATAPPAPVALPTDASVENAGDTSTCAKAYGTQ